jgi:TetR/AcrR family transcriptional repressor of bet genes
MGRPSNRVERRAQIVDGLLMVMAREGYERASMAAVARAAGLSPGLLHYHFDGKHQILVELVHRLVAQVAARAAALLERAGDQPRRRLYAFLDAHVALGDEADEHAVAAWVAVGTEAMRDRQVRALYVRALDESLTWLRQLVTDCLRDEKRVTRNGARIAAALLSAVEGAYRVRTAAPALLPAGFAAPTLRAMVDGLVGAEARR